MSSEDGPSYADPFIAELATFHREKIKVHIESFLKERAGSVKIDVEGEQRQEWYEMYIQYQLLYEQKLEEFCAGKNMSHFDFMVKLREASAKDDKVKKFVDNMLDGASYQTFSKWLINVTAVAVPLHVDAISENLAEVMSDDAAAQTKATQFFRRLLSIERNPPIQQVVDCGAVPRFVQFLQRHDSPTLQFEAAWALTNIASGTSQHTKYVIDAGAVPIFVQLLGSPNEEVREQAAWALGNVAGDSVGCRDYVLDQGAMQALLQVCSTFTEHSRVSTIRNVTWTLSNLCRGKPVPALHLVSAALPLLQQLICSSDMETVTDACWALSYISDGSNDRIEAVLQAGVAPKLVELLHSPTQDKPSPAQTPALRALGNIVSGDDGQTQRIIGLNALPALLLLLDHPKKNLRKEACWTISITAGTTDQVQAILDANIFPKLIELLQSAEFDIQKEATWAVSNATSGGNAQQISHLVQAGVIPPLCQLLAANDAKVVAVALEGLENVLHKLPAEHRGHGLEIFVECGGVDRLANLQEHESTRICQRAMRVLEAYFAKEGQNLAPTRQKALEAAKAGDLAPLKAVLSSTDTLNSLSRFGKTILTEYSFLGMTEAVKLILQQPGIDVNQFEASGYNALMRACNFAKAEVVAALLQHPDTDVNLLDKGNEKRSALRWACCAYGIPDRRGPIPEIVGLMVQHPALDMNQLGQDGKTILKFCMEKKYAPLVEILQGAGALVSVTAPATSSSKAEAGLKIKSAAAAGDVDALKTLIAEWSGDWEALSWADPGDNGKTALDCSASPEVASLLQSALSGPAFLHGLLRSGASTMGIYFGQVRAKVLEDDASATANIGDLLDTLASALNVANDDDVVLSEAVECVLEEVRGMGHAPSLLETLKRVRAYMFELAYEEALGGDKRLFMRSRLMIVGEGGAGKTSFLRALTAKKFEPEWKSTVGLCLEDFSVLREAGVGVSEFTSGSAQWVEQDRGVSESDRTLRREVIVHATKNLQQKKKKKKTLRERKSAVVKANPHTSAHPSVEEMAETETEPIAADATTTATFNAVVSAVSDLALSPRSSMIAAVTSMTLALPSRKSRAVDDEGEEEVEEELDTDVDMATSLGAFKLNAFTNSEGEAVSFSCWDFGGQRVFQTVQHLFLSRYGVYVIAFDMCNLCADHVSGKAVENSISYLRFWLRQISMAALGAPILLLGTHKDSLANEEWHAELSQRLLLEFSSSEKAWAHVHVNAEDGLCFFPVANFSDDRNIGRLRHLIEALAVDDRISPGDEEGYVHSKIPVSWLAVCDRMREMERRGVPYLRVRAEADVDDGEATASSLAASCGVFDLTSSESERNIVLSAMLSLFARLGIVVYIEAAGLSNVVILNPQWLIDMLVCIIRDFQLHMLKRDRKLIQESRKKWYDFTTKGRLSRSMLLVLWREEQSNIDFLLLLLGHMQLLCELPSAAADMDAKTAALDACAEARYLVPSVFMATDDEVPLRQSPFTGSEDFCCTIEVRFREFLPDGLLNRLIVLLSSKCTATLPFPMDKRETMPCLFHQSGVLCCALPIAGCGVVVCQDTHNIFAHVFHSDSFVLGKEIELVLEGALDVLQKGFYRGVPYTLVPPPEGYPRPMSASGGALNAVRNSSLLATMSPPRITERAANPLAPTLSAEYVKAGYYCVPAVEDLQACADSELSSLALFIVGRQGVGEVRWQERVDVRGLDVSAALRIERLRAELLSEEAELRLNRRAHVTFNGVQGVDADGVRDACERRGAALEHFSTKTGELSISLQGFPCPTFAPADTPRRPQLDRRSSKRNVWADDEGSRGGNKSRGGKCGDRGRDGEDDDEEEEEEDEAAAIDRITKWLHRELADIDIRMAKKACKKMAVTIYEDGGSGYADSRFLVRSFATGKLRDTDIFAWFTRSGDRNAIIELLTKLSDDWRRQHVSGGESPTSPVVKKTALRAVDASPARLSSMPNSPSSPHIIRMRRKTHAFLSHDWGIDSLNHERVRRVSVELQSHGVICWLDEAEMEGDIHQKMSEGIDHAVVVVVFLTENYANKANSNNKNDNVCYEFGHASRTHANDLVLCVMEPEMLATSHYCGKVMSFLGGLLYIDMSNAAAEEAEFKSKCADLASRILDKYKKKLALEEILPIDAGF